MLTMTIPDYYDRCVESYSEPGLPSLAAISPTHTEK